MKRILLLLLCFTSISLCAQITVFSSYIIPGDETDVPAITRFGQCAVDSIKFKIIGNRGVKEDYTGLDYGGSMEYHAMKKDGLTIFHKKTPADSSDSTSYYLVNIDSISYKKYPTTNISIPDTVKLILDNWYSKVDEYLNYANFTFEPFYSTDIPIVQFVDPAIVDCKITSWNNGTDVKHWTLLGTGNDNPKQKIFLYPRKVGKTQASITMGSITKTLTIIVENEEFKELTTEEIYDRIFSRLILTDDSINGFGDIPNIDQSITCFYRLIHELQELPSDLQWWRWNDAGIGDIRVHQWRSTNDLLDGLYRRIMYNIELCNAYLDRTKGQSAGTIKAKRGEALFLRAFYYSYMEDLFGRAPICVSTKYEVLPPQSNRSDIFDQIIKDLKESLIMLPAVGQKTGYYRLDQAAAWMLLARMYLNAEAYIGKEHWAEAAYYADLVMNSSYSLCPNYRDMFMGDNSNNGAMQEFIMAIRQNGEETQSYGGQYNICSYYAHGESDLVNLETWECYRSQKRLVSLFFPNGTTVQGTATELTLAAGDYRALLRNYYNGVTWKLPKDYTSSNDDMYFCWGIQKWTNVPANEKYKPSSQRWPDTDIPLMRTAEAYLTYAEAQYRLGNIEDALTAINAIRSRANATEYSSLSLQDILDEWGREFYAEGRRRSDLIRFGKFGGDNDYRWERKVNNFDIHFNVYPIPEDQLMANPDFEQNLGY